MNPDNDNDNDNAYDKPGPQLYVGEMYIHGYANGNGPICCDTPEALLTFLAEYPTAEVVASGTLGSRVLRADLHWLVNELREV